MSPRLQKGDRHEFFCIVPRSTSGKAVPEHRIRMPVEKDAECVSVARDALMPQVFVSFPL
ncbi:hypothetical protein ANMWB30_11860 [Arthrobacter sp. MWB30]|nr:hypothetical protein ANMWB30_11860 [Arthrobacter sp. MWB30]